MPHGEARPSFGQRSRSASLPKPGSRKFRMRRPRQRGSPRADRRGGSPQREAAAARLGPLRPPREAPAAAVRGAARRVGFLLLGWGVAARGPDRRSRALRDPGRRARGPQRRLRGAAFLQGGESGRDQGAGGSGGDFGRGISPCHLERSDEGSLSRLDHDSKGIPRCARDDTGGRRRRPCHPPRRKPHRLQEPLSPLDRRRAG